MSFDWKKPDYTAILAERAKRVAKLRGMSLDELAALKAFYREHPVEFINDWGMTSDPRNVEIGLPVHVPFMLFPKQAEFVEWVYARWRLARTACREEPRHGRELAVLRDRGHMWLFFPDMQIGFGSRKEEYVDEIGNLKALFPKIRLFVDLLPREFRPKGGRAASTCCSSTQRTALRSSARPATTSAAAPGPGSTSRTRAPSTSARRRSRRRSARRPTARSTSRRRTGRATLLSQAPRRQDRRLHLPLEGRSAQGQAWYEKQQRDLDPVILAQEVDIDYTTRRFRTPGSTARCSKPRSTLGAGDVDAIGPKVLGVDAAHEGDDNSCLTFRRGRVSPWTKEKKGRIDGPDLAGWVIEEADALDGVDCIVIELDGPGVSCYDTLKRSKYAECHGRRPHRRRRSDGKNYNLRAKMWRGLLEWLKDTPCSITRDGELKAEATAMRYSYKDGLLLMEDKKEYKKRVGKSPDRADSFALTFAIDAMPKQQAFVPSVPSMAIPEVTMLRPRRPAAARAAQPVPDRAPLRHHPRRQWEGDFGEAFDDAIKLEINLTKDGLDKIYRDYNENRIVPDFRPAGGKGDEDSARRSTGCTAPTALLQVAAGRDNAFGEAIGGRVRRLSPDQRMGRPYDKDSDHQRINPA
jgi:phage terminase large subunit